MGPLGDIGDAVIGAVIALAAKMQERVAAGRDGLTIGDGATSTGAFHEA